MLAVATKGNDPAAMARAAVNALGGMKKFVHKGNMVVIKPNMGWARKPEQAATTNPQIIVELIRMCQEAGAREIRVMDHPVDGPESAVMKITGIQDAVTKAGARMVSAASQAAYASVTMRRGKSLKRADVLRDVRRADVLINVPIAKVHGSTGLTLGAKNLMGTVWDRGAWHQAALDQCIADFLSEVRPHLTVLDAYRMLMSNGPKGPGQIKNQNTVAACVDPVAIDAFGATLMGHTPVSVGHLRLAHDMGLGEIDLKRVQIKRV